MSKSGAQRTPTTTPARQAETRPKDPAGRAGAPGAVGTILRLQQTAGNRAVSDLIGSGDGNGRRAGPDAATLAPGEEVSSATFRAQVSQSLPSGRLLDGRVRRSLESAFSQDFGGVRIHTDASAARAAAAIGARAFTLGNSIWFGRGQYRPETRSGRHLLAHELAHTVQQRGQPPILQPSLLIGSSTDPAEISADRAADVVLGGGRMPHLVAARAVVRRAKVTSVSSGKNPDERVVETDDGSIYRVTRTRTVRPVTSEEPIPPRLRPRINKDRVWIDIEWCQGTKGTISVGANAPEAVLDLAKRMGKTILAGGDQRQVLEDLKNSTIKPFVGFDIAASGAWQVTGEINVTVGRDGVTAGGGKIGVKKGPVEGNIEGQGSKEGGATITGNIKITPGQTNKKFTCPTRERVRLVQETDYTCRLERRIPPGKEKRKRTVQKTDERSRYIYFVYAVDTIEPKQSAAELAALQRDLSEGFRVSNITAYTSPEGPQAKVPGFRGNDQLATDRAVAARKYIEANCTVEGGSCFIIGPTATTGAGELYTIVRPDPRTGADKEVEGDELATHAVGEFETQAAEERHRTPELEGQIAKQKTPRKKAALVYPLLRRAVVTLTRTRPVEEEYEVDVPARTESNPVTCPDEVREAAISNFQIADSLK